MHGARSRLACPFHMSPPGTANNNASLMARTYPFPPPVVLGHAHGEEEFKFPVILALHDPSEIVLNAWEGTMLRRIESCVLAHATQAGRQARALGLPPSEVLKAIRAMGQAILGGDVGKHACRTAGALL